jgi:hypothetical protein
LLRPAALRCIYQSDITLIDAWNGQAQQQAGVITMSALTDYSTSPQRDQAPGPIGMASSWAQGRRRITPWAYPYLGALSAVRLTVGLFLLGLGALFLSQDHGGSAAIALVGAAACLSIGYLDGAAARSVHPRA